MPKQARRRHPVIRAVSWVLVLGLLGLGLGYAAATRLDSRGVGRSTVLLKPMPGNAFSARRADTSVDLKTDAQVALSDAVLQPVVAALHNGLTVGAIRSQLSVSLINNAEVIVINYQGRTSAQAIDVARRVAEQLLIVRTNLAKANFKAQAAILTPELTSAEARAATAIKDTGQGKKANGEAESILNQRVVSLRSQLRTVQSDPPGPGTVLATTAPIQSSVRKIQLGLVALGALIAAVVGLWPGAGRQRRGGRPPASVTTMRRAW
jgi:hypothetical protein